MRLHRGDFAAETVYDDDPVRVARGFADAGAPWIHVVDLDAARTGELVHRDVVAAICTAVPVRVQVGGGVRTSDAAETLFETGVARVVIGTAAVEDPDLVTTLAHRHPGAVAVALDARGREVAVHGWRRRAGLDLLEVATTMGERGAATLVVTEIGRDGTLEGPDLEQLAAVLTATQTPVVASGGVGSLDDLRALTRLDVDGRRLVGAIVGRAIYEGRMSLREALAATGG